MRIVGLIGAPSSAGRTRALVEAIIDGARTDADPRVELIQLGERPLPFADGTRAEEQPGDAGVVLKALENGDAFVLGTPIYRGTQSAVMKNLLDLTPRGTYDGNARPFQAKPVAVAATAAAPEHFLALNDLCEIMRGFFASWVVPPGVFATHKHFGPDGHLADGGVLANAHTAGRALVALHKSLLEHDALRSVEPQI
jgi:FMN reductase